MAEGIEVRHRKGCHGGSRCGCKPSYRAIVWDPLRSVQVRDWETGKRLGRIPNQEGDQNGDDDGGFETLAQADQSAAE